MKLIHLSDLHLGKRLKGYSLIEDQKFILEQILEIIKNQKANGVLIAGDVYDKSLPPAEAVTLFSNFLTKLNKEKIPVFIISGNHDSGERLSFGEKIMENENIFFSGIFDGKIKKITLQDEFGNVNIFLMPFVRPVIIHEYFPDEKIENYDDAVRVLVSHTEIDEGERNIIVAHQYVRGANLCDSEETNIGTLDCIGADIFEKFDYTALGHIHGPQRISGKENVRYCGTPLKYSLSEINHNKSVTVVNIGEKSDVTIEQIPLEPLRDMRKIKGKFADVCNSGKSDDYIHVTLTDDNIVVFAAEKLRENFPNLLSVDYENNHTKSITEINFADKTREKTPEEYIEDFYAKTKGKDMSSGEKKIISEIIEEIRKEQA